nr:hexokinase-9 [Quercus suber]
MTTNAAYVEPAHAVPRWQGLSPNSEEMVISIEWGNFNSIHFALTEFQSRLDAESSNPGSQIFEKLIAGTYLGEVVRRVLLKMAQETALFGDSVPSKLNTPYILSKLDHNDWDYDIWLESEGSLAKNQKQFGSSLHASLFSPARRSVMVVPGFYTLKRKTATPSASATRPEDEGLTSDEPPPTEELKVDSSKLDHNDWDYDIWLESEGSLAKNQKQFGSSLHASLFSPARRSVMVVPGFYTLKRKTATPSASATRPEDEGLTSDEPPPTEEQKVVQTWQHLLRSRRKPIQLRSQFNPETAIVVLKSMFLKIFHTIRNQLLQQIMTQLCPKILELAVIFLQRIQVTLF